EERCRNFLIGFLIGFLFKVKTLVSITFGIISIFVFGEIRSILSPKSWDTGKMMSEFFTICLIKNLSTKLIFSNCSFLKPVQCSVMTYFLCLNFFRNKAKIPAGYVTFK